MLFWESSYAIWEREEGAEPKFGEFEFNQHTSKPYAKIIKVKLSELKTITDVHIVYFVCLNILFIAILSADCRSSLAVWMKR